MSTSIENRGWNDILLAVEKRLNRQSFETWIRPIHFEGFDEAGHVLYLRAPNHVVKDWVSSNYSDVLDASLSELNMTEYELNWTVEEEPQTPSRMVVKDDDLGDVELKAERGPASSKTEIGRASSRERV